MGLGLVCFLCIMLSSYGFTSRIPQSCIEWRARGPSASLAARFFRLLVIESICEVSLRFGVQDIAIPDDDTQLTYILVLHSLKLGSGGIPSCIVHSLLWWVQGWYASCVSWFSSYGFTSHMHTSVLHLSVKHLVVIGEFMKWAWGLGYRKL